MRITLLAVLFVAAACGGDPAQDSEPESAGEEIAEDYNQILEDAANVELELQKSKDRIDAQDSD